MPEESRAYLRYHTTHVSKWLISNFKSIGSAEVDLEHGHLTVLTGANSIGKSSLVQSLLLLCQSINNGREIVLNGELAKLGVSSDVIRDGEDKFGFEMEYMRRPLGLGEESKVTATVLMTSARKLRYLDDVGTLAVCDVTIETDSGTKFSLSSNGAKKEDIDACLAMEDGSTHGCSLLKVLGGARSLDRTYVAFRGVLPVSIIKLRGESTSLNFCRNSVSSFFKKSVDNTVPRYIYEAAAQALIDRGVEMDRVNPFLDKAKQSEIRKAAKTIEKRERQAFVEEVARRAYRYRAQSVTPLTGARAYLDALLSSGEEESLSKEFRQLRQEMNDLLGALNSVSSRVEYIGPLRDDPRVVSPLTETPVSNLPIGKKGEKAAAVLLAKAHQKASYGFPGSLGVQESTLEEAVNAWTSYLGVASGVHVSDMRKLGVSLHVKSDSSHERDLTMVGVGASQAIPILVGVLGAKQESIIIIEQPELHLHPSAQAKLADFFLIARPDLTMIIESHSEALVTRLRRRVVEDEELSKRISILFFEAGDNSSCVKTKALSIDEYGNLEEWPRGFMDAVQEDSRAILQASVAKRRRLRSANA